LGDGIIDVREGGKLSKSEHPVAIDQNELTPLGVCL
jgi:hypothetical protein